MGTESFRGLEGMESFMQLFGDVEPMGERYPQTYSACVRTQRNIPWDVRLRGKGSPERKLDIEVVHISHTDDTKQSVQVELRVKAEGIKKKGGYRVFWAFCPQDTEGAAQSKKNVNCNFTGSQDLLSVTIPTSCFGNPEKGSVEVEVHLYTVDDTVTFYKGRKALDSYGLDYGSTITVESPVRKHKNERNQDINICYLMQPGAWTDLVDYFYSARDLGERRDLMIPAKGRIEVRGVHLTGVEKCNLMVVNAAGERYLHCSPEAQLINGCTIKWDIADDWGFPYRDVLRQNYSYVTYLLEITARARDVTYTFLVTSDQDARPARNKEIIPRIYIYKDCFAKGTLIELSDGGVKAVEELRSGDEVRTPDGGGRAVCSVECVEMDTAMMRVRTEDDREVFVSLDHPFATNRGLVCANFLREGDEVLTGEGSAKIQEVCAAPKVHATLYHVVVDERKGGRIYANGFLVGDSMAELDAAERANNIKYRVPQKWWKDYESWMERIGNKDI